MKPIPREHYALCGVHFRNDAISIASIQKIICTYYDVPYNKIFIKRDRKNYIAIQVRQMAIYLSQLFRNDTIVTIGIHFRRKHDQINHATSMALKRMGQSEAFRDGIVRLIEKIITHISTTST